jgi:hypothetical protein
VEQLLGGSGDFSWAGKAHTWGSGEYHVHGGLSPHRSTNVLLLSGCRGANLRKLIAKGCQSFPVGKEATPAKVYDES